MAGFELIIKSLESRLKNSVGEISGTDTDDKIYDSIEELWNSELNMDGNDDNDSWYKNAFEFWEDEQKCPITDDGVLQGFGRLTEPDVYGSNMFLDKVLLLIPDLKLDRAADCGAGIGRVSKYFLLNRFQNVDLIEQSPRLLAASIQYIGDNHTKTTRINIGLQDFLPQPQSYDVIWIQWVIGHLHDMHMIRFFQRCAKGLKPNGVIILKDNTTEGDWTFVVDRSDSSVSRSREYILVLAEYAGLNCILQEKQTGFPEDLFPVLMFAFVPK